MKQRIISAAIIIPIVAAALILGGIVLQVLVLAVTVASIYEITKALKARDIRVISVLNYLYAAVAAVMIYFNGGKMLFPILFIATMITLTVPIVIKRYNIKDALATVAVLVYPTTFILLLSLINNFGRWYVLGAILASVIVDTAAYFTGKTWGKKKLCPEVSPHKTVEGAVGGAAATIVLFTIYGILVDLLALGHPFSFGTLTSWFSLSLLCGIFAQLGDLAASAIKRYCGIKDYSNLLPGHGGIMDRLDSIMFTSALVYLFLVLGII